MDLGSLVQQQLSLAESGLPVGAPRTLEDLDNVVKELCKIAKICFDYMEHVKEKPVTRALKEMEYGFEWDRFIQEIQRDCSSSSPTFLFHAARRTRPLSSYIIPSQRLEVFRISDVLRYLEKRNQAHGIDEELQKWTRNCDEYIAVGTLSKYQLIRSIPWKVLRRMPLLTDTFHRAYTLEIYRQWCTEMCNRHGNVEKDQVFSRTLESARIIAGKERENFKRVAEMIDLILEPGLFFWGIDTDVTEDDVRLGCIALLKEDWARQKLI
ncbi:hypothetical protein PMIN04_011535 [Paraphaeosphaeria minitans]